VTAIPALLLAVLLQSPPTARESLDPRLLKSMRDKLQTYSLPTIGQLDARLQALRRDNAALSANLSRRVLVLADEIETLSEQVDKLKTDVEAKDMSRVAVLEAKLQAAEDAKRLAAEQSLRDHEAAMQWVRPVFVGVACSVLVSIVGLLLGYLRGKSITELAQKLNGKIE
jgi:hypothetical protein